MVQDLGNLISKEPKNRSDPDIIHYDSKNKSLPSTFLMDHLRNQPVVYLSFIYFAWVKFSLSSLQRKVLGRLLSFLPGLSLRGNKKFSKFYQMTLYEFFWKDIREIYFWLQKIVIYEKDFFNHGRENISLSICMVNITL